MPDLRHFEFAHPEMRKQDVARLLGVAPSRYSKLRNHLRYRPVPTDVEVSAIAKLLNRSASYVRRLYALPSYRER